MQQRGSDRNDIVCNFKSIYIHIYRMIYEILITSLKIYIRRFTYFFFYEQMWNRKYIFIIHIQYENIFNTISKDD